MEQANKNPQVLAKGFFTFLSKWYVGIIKPLKSDL